MKTPNWNKADLINSTGIYAFRNKLNGKIYVGQSKRVLTRKRQHERGDLGNSRRFHNAMKRYGSEGFDYAVLEYCESKQLDAREVFWIEKLCSLYPDGYNLLSGGGAFQKHHAETRKKMSENQKRRVNEGVHPFASEEFQKKNALKQKELAKEGRHSSQQSWFQEKRNKTVNERIEQTGKFFSHTPETIEVYRKQQLDLYSEGRGKFQDPKLIEQNKIRVRERLAEGTHHTQRPDWSGKAREAARPQMKGVVLAIRKLDGDTVEMTFESINHACRELGAGKRGISSLCNKLPNVETVGCAVGKVIRGSFGQKPNWNLRELQKMPDSAFTRLMKVRFTILKEDGKNCIRTYLGLREGCRELEAGKSAVRWMLKGEKYKSTKCNLGRIVKVEEVF